MLVSEWLDAAQSVETYKALLAFAATHDRLDPQAKLAYYRVFHFHPHKHPDLAQLVAEEHPLDPAHPVALRQRASESETKVPARTSVEIPSLGPSQDIPMLSSWEGFGEIRIVVSRRVTF